MPIPPDSQTHMHTELQPHPGLALRSADIVIEHQGRDLPNRALSHLLSYIPIAHKTEQLPGYQCIYIYELSCNYAQPTAAQQHFKQWWVGDTYRVPFNNTHA